MPLDIFRENLHNRGIRNRLDAWLTFMSEDDPAWIVRLITDYPHFRAMYETIYTMCSNVERVMEMFSEELRILDRNTVMGMIDEMQEEISRKNKELEKQKKLIEELQRKLEDKEKK